MINFINAIIFGIVQGLTEFLPVSSTGHLVILHELIKIPIINELAFDVMLHLGTFLAIFWFFRKEIFQLFFGWLKSLQGKKNKEGNLSWMIIIGTVPAVFFGLLWNDIIEEKLRSPIYVIIMLVLIGLLFILVEKKFKQNNNLNNLNWKKSLYIGSAQAIALIPGTSRSGITIIAGLTVGLKREEALKYSFLLSMPVILGAAITKIPLLFTSGITVSEYTLLMVSFLATFISGLIAIKYFLQYSRRYSLNIFAYYRFILALILLFYFYL
jgi:undecaprenyl-diphosphatase